MAKPRAGFLCLSGGRKIPLGRRPETPEQVQNMVLFNFQKQSASSAMIWEDPCPGLFSSCALWEQCCLPWCSSGTVGSTAFLLHPWMMHFYCILGGCEQRLPSPWDECRVCGFGPWLSDSVVPSQAEPCSSTTTAHTAQDRDSQGHRASFPHTGGVASSARGIQRGSLTRLAAVGSGYSPVVMGAATPWNRCPG